MPTIRLLLVSDNVDFVEGLRAWLTKEPDIDLVGVEHSGVDVIERIAEIRPRIVLMDATLSGTSGFATCRRIRAELGFPTVLMTFHDSETVRREAQAVGADGVVGKGQIAVALLPLVRALAAEPAPDRSPEKSPELLARVEPNQEPGLPVGDSRTPCREPPDC